MNVSRTMEVAVKFATTHLVALSVLVKKVMCWTLMALTAQVSETYIQTYTHILS